MVHSAVNWNTKEDEYSQMFWKQNTAQFWSEEEIVVSGDKNTWNTLSKAEQTAYKKALGGLTLLDTKQGGEGMPLVAIHTRNLQAKSVLMFMGAMEEVHAKSYSHIFTTLATEEEIKELFEWVDNNHYLQRKATMITAHYKKLLKPDVTAEELYKAMVASVMLETYLFYSGFFYPLYLAGQGKLVASGEIINLIIRDEAIHGVFVGLLAQELFKTFSEEKQNELRQYTYFFVEKLYENERQYTEHIYSEVGLVGDVLDFVKYNANKALMNLGFESLYTENTINPVVMNGLNTEGKTHDFFSVKGNSYLTVTKVEEITDDVFDF